jgi:MFS family permease
MPAPWRQRPQFYGWYIVAAGAMNSFVTLGVTAFGLGVFIQPIREETGWSLTAIALGYSIRSFEAGLLSPFTGVLVDRLGPRRMAIAGVVVVALGLLLFSQARQLSQYYGASVLIAIGQSLGGFSAFSTSVMQWFVRRRGKAMGFLTAGNGAGYLMAPILAVLIGVAGWRTAMLIAAITLLVICLPLSLVLRDRPERYGLLPDGEGTPTEEESRAPVSATGMSVSRAFRTPAFYLLILAMASGGPVQGVWIALQVPHLTHVGYSLAAAASITGAYGLVQIGLRSVLGGVADRLGRKRMYTLCYLLQGVGLMIFAFMDVSRPWLIVLFYATYAVGHGLWVILFMAVTADYFGTRRFATLRGLMSSLQTPLTVVAPLVAGMTFDRTGSYTWVFFFGGLITASGAAWIALIRRPTWAQSEAALAEATLIEERALPTSAEAAAHRP